MKTEIGKKVLLCVVIGYFTLKIMHLRLFLKKQGLKVNFLCMEILKDDYIKPNNVLVFSNGWWGVV